MRVSDRLTNKMLAMSALLLGLTIFELATPTRAQQLPSGFIHDGTYDYTLSEAFTLPQPPKPQYLAQVTVSGNSTALTSTDIAITLNLNNGFGLHETTGGGKHGAFYFNMADNGTPLTIANATLNGVALPGNFLTLVPTPDNPSPFNNSGFGWAISFSCTATTCGGPNNPGVKGLVGTVSFDIEPADNKTGITLVAANGTHNNQLLYFASDLIDTSNSSNTGNAAVPSPH